MILAIETSTLVCSVAIGRGLRPSVEKRIEGRGVHSERTFTFIRELLERNKIGVEDLDAVLFSSGPGSYTGLRIGAAAIKGLLFQRNVPLFTLPTLIAFSVPLLDNISTRVHSVIDARREHLYHQKIESDSSKKITITKPAVKKITRLEEEIIRGDVVVGTGWNRINVEFKDDVTWLGSEAISAKNLILGWNRPEIKELFEQKNPVEFEPDYLSMSQINNSPAG